ncbi:N-acetylmuramoyl-L-alanine amidase family protein [Clostridium thermarum]|uniref:N-acetylmuramoyl-L-alanine amidase family protein n=1 Tax=Clostridium thermarum TaxID=1716543 RepID=UPI0013D6BE22|nr:N-acetylmuramoyl-L-alanine amidase [Clostridium thermarum]
MRKRVKKPFRFITSIFLFAIILFSIGKFIVNLSPEKAAEEKSVIKETLSNNLIEGKPVEIKENGNISKEENSHFKKYVIELMNREAYIDDDQNERYIYIFLKDPKSHKLGQTSFQEEDKDIFFAEVEGKDALVVKKNFENNNFVFLNELTSSLIVLVSKEKEPFKNIAVIDPGHGGVDPGTEAYDKSFVEKDINLKIAKEMRQELIFNGIEVSLSRDDDTLNKLSDVVDYTKSKDPDVFVSIHINSYDKSSKYNGLSAYYSKENAVSTESMALATAIQKHIISTDGWNDRQVKEEAFYVIKHNPMPAVLVECGFASNPEDVARLNNNEVLNNLAKNISKGIIEFLSPKSNP